MWPGVTALPDFKTSFPQWSVKDLRTSVTGMDEVSADLLAVSPSYLILHYPGLIE